MISCFHCLHEHLATYEMLEKMQNTSYMYVIELQH